VRNISVTGAVGVLMGPQLMRGTVHPLYIGGATDTLELNVQVVRAHPVGEWWETAVAFQGPATPHRIGAFIAMLMRGFRQP